MRAGTLKANEKVVIRRRSAPPVRGTLEPDGRIKIGTSSYATPSKAARVALDLKAADGWVRWRVPRLDYQTLAEIREANS